MVANLVLDHPRRDIEFRGKFVDLLRANHVRCKPRAKQLPGCEELSREGTRLLLPRCVGGGEQQLALRRSCPASTDGRACRNRRDAELTVAV